MRGLRLEINSQKHLRFATYWVIATIAIHNFAIQHEAGEDFSIDEFFRTGMRELQEDREHFAAEARLAEEEATAEDNARAALREVELLYAKLKREELKKELFNYLNDN